MRKWAGIGIAGAIASVATSLSNVRAIEIMAVTKPILPGCASGAVVSAATVLIY